MSNQKKRVERLEKQRKRGIPIIRLNPGETSEQGKARYLLEHPQNKDAPIFIIFSSGPLPSEPLPGPPIRPEIVIPQQGVPSPKPRAPRMITR